MGNVKVKPNEPAAQHLTGAVYENRDQYGERWRATCTCGWWAPVRSYDATLSSARGHLDAL